MQNLHHIVEELGHVVRDQELHDQHEISVFTIARLRRLFLNYQFRFLVEMVIDYRGPTFSTLPNDDDRDSWKKLYLVAKLVNERYLTTKQKVHEDRVITKMLLTKY